MTEFLQRICSSIPLTGCTQFSKKIIGSLLQNRCLWVQKDVCKQNTHASKIREFAFMQCFSLKENAEPPQLLILYVNLYFKGFNNLWKKASYIFPFSSHSIFSLNLLNKARIRSVIIAMHSWCPLRTFCTFMVIPSLARSVDYNIVHLSSLFMI